VEGLRQPPQQSAQPGHWPRRVPGEPAHSHQRLRAGLSGPQGQSRYARRRSEVCRQSPRLAAVRPARLYAGRQSGDAVPRAGRRFLLDLHASRRRHHRLFRAGVRRADQDL
jgi:hypothetical protein